MIGRYDFKAIFDKEPAVIAGTIRAILMVAVLFGLAIDEKQLAGISLVLELGLTLLVRQNVTPNTTVADIVHTPPPGPGPIAAAEAAGVDTGEGSIKP